MTVWCQPIIVAASAPVPAANANVGSSNASVNRLSNRPVTLSKRVPNMSGRHYQTNGWAVRPRSLGQSGMGYGLAVNDMGVTHAAPLSR